MKVVKTLLLISIVAALFVSIAFAAEPAQPVPPPRAPAGGPGGPGGQRMGMGRMMMNPARMVVAMRDQLNLTDEQVTKLEALKPADPNAAQQAQQKLNEIQRELNVAVMADDTAKIKGLCAKLGDATEKTSLLQAKTYTQINQILTANQFKQLQQMMSGPMGMGGGGMGGGRMGGGQGGQRPGGPPGGPPPGQGGPPPGHPPVN
jgi:Spy/CpxP family protein refolding chaperone